MQISSNDVVDTSVLLSDSQVEAIVSSAESALEVSRRYQFFVWTQGSLQVLLPHQLAICGAYSRLRQELQFEAFNSVQVEAALLTDLADGRNALLSLLQSCWLDARCKPICLHVDLIERQSESLVATCQQLRQAGFHELLAHGVSRPHRSSEIESFFVLGWQHRRYEPRHRLCLELLMPHIHSTWQRVQSIERELKELPPSSGQRSSTGTQITERERQILRWLREGLSNPQIGETLGISALTVKNHVQKILRKLNAANRAQAVAIAISMNLLRSSAHAGENTGETRRAP